MIYIYNQTNKPQWNVIDKAERFARIATVDDAKFGIDIFKTAGMEDAVMRIDLSDEFGHRFDIVKVSDLTTTIRFDHRHFNPFIMPVEEGNNTDILLISVSLDEGKEMINYFSRDAFVYYYKIDAEHDVMHFVVSFNVNEQMPFIQFILRGYDRDMVTRVMVRYSDRRNAYEVTNTTIAKIEVPAKGQRGYFDTSDRRLEDGTHPIHVYRPARPTHTIVKLDDVTDEQMDRIKHRYHLTDRSAKFVAPRELRNYARKTRISAVTYVINKDTKSIIDNKDEVIESLAKLGVHFYRTVNVVSNEGKVIRIK